MAFKAFSNFTRKYPILRGMITYAIVWPASNVCQQIIEERKHYDFKETARFGIFGGLYVAPTVYLWVKISSYLIPGNTIFVALKKAIVEQILYSPFAISSFYVGMDLLEGRSFAYAKEELRRKFLPTYKAYICYWPFVQTLNFRFVQERNRVSVSATASFFWTIFLSYMKHLENKSKLAQAQTKHNR